MKALILTLLLAAPVEEAGSPSRAVACACDDAAKLPVKEAPYYRYLWTSSPAEKRDDFLVALRVHLNLLSTQGKLATPTLIAPDVVRIDVREYGWEKRLEVWERLADNDPYFHVPLKAVEDVEVKQFWPGGLSKGGKHYDKGRYDVKVRAGKTEQIPAPWLPQHRLYDLRALTYSESPVLHAEWFFVQTARQISIRNKDEKVGYYEWLGLKNRDDFFKLTGTDEKVADKIFRHWRAVVEKSGISQQNRQVVALGATSGRVWGTLDTFSEVGRGIAKRNLRKGEFAHDAEEWYGFLPNGLWVTLLVNKDGVAQATAPDQIGPDDSALRVGRDARVHANLSCIRCHGGDKDMLKPVDDWARRTFRQGGVLRLTDPDKKVILELESQYLRDLDRLLARDRSDYIDALREATVSKKHPKGMMPAEFAKVYGEAWNRYVESRITVEDAARELGTTALALQTAIKRYNALRGGGDLVLTSYIDEPAGKLSRLEWESCYALAASLVAGVQPPEIAEEKK